MDERREREKVQTGTHPKGSSWLPPNTALQLTAFGARDRRHFDSFRSAPRRQLKRRPFGGHLSTRGNFDLHYH